MCGNHTTKYVTRGHRSLPPTRMPNLSAQQGWCERPIRNVMVPAGRGLSGSIGHWMTIVIMVGHSSSKIQEDTARCPWAAKVSVYKLIKV